MRMLQAMKWAATVLAMLLLSGCYTSETAVLTAQNAAPLIGMSEGLYCHAENRLVPPQVTVNPQISDALGSNQCRDLYWEAEEARYVDRLSASMVLRTAPGAAGTLAVLQAQTSANALARYMPVAAVDGMFILFDPAGEWPADLVATAGLELTVDGSLAAADPSRIRALLDIIWERVLDDFRTDIAFVEDADGPRLEFRRVDTAYRYLVYFRKDWAGDEALMRGAMVALADLLGLGRYEETWTEHTE